MTAWQDPVESPVPPQFMLPRLTPAVKKLMIVNAALYLVTLLLYLTDGQLGLYTPIMKPLRLDPAMWASHFPLVPIWQLVTYGFLHSPDPMHVLQNMLLLYFFGTMLEEWLGSRRFVLTYLGAMVAGGALFLVPVFFTRDLVPAIGASGACMGVMIAVATMRPRLQVILLFIPVMLKWLAIGILVLTIIWALLDLKNGASGVAHLVHLGGVIYGFVAVRSGLVRKDPIEAIERKRAVAEVTRAADDEARVDQLLEKIHRDGMSSLTRSEKEFLKRVSSRH
jgi:membrane associated rhomboid family serine protease